MKTQVTDIQTLQQRLAEKEAEAARIASEKRGAEGYLAELVAKAEALEQEQKRKEQESLLSEAPGEAAQSVEGADSPAQAREGFLKRVFKKLVNGVIKTGKYLFHRGALFQSHANAKKAAGITPQAKEAAEPEQQSAAVKQEQAQAPVEQVA